MAAILGLVGVLLVAAIFTTTAESRREAREKIRPLGRWLLVPTIVLWVLILWPWGK